MTKCFLLFDRMSMQKWRNAIELLKIMHYFILRRGPLAPVILKLLFCPFTEITPFLENSV